MTLSNLQNQEVYLERQELDHPVEEAVVQS